MNNGEEKGRLSFRFCLRNKRRKVAGICYEYGFGFHAFFCYSFMVFIEACAGGEEYIYFLLYIKHFFLFNINVRKFLMTKIMRIIRLQNMNTNS